MFSANLKGRVAVVTGAASGIGLAVANSLARAQAKVCLVDIQRDELEIGAAKINKNGGEALPVWADLSSPKEIKAFYRQVGEKFGKADILINNAGLQYLSPLESFPLEQWDKLFAIMLRGAFLCTQAFLPDFIEKGWGRIINIASIHSIVASPFKSAYVSAKHGLLGLTKTAALEAAASGVTVNSISPAYVRTPLVEKQIESQSKVHSIPKERVVKEIMLAPMPQRELIEPEEIGEMVLFLCAETARHINGHNLVVDGGWTIT